MTPIYAIGDIHGQMAMLDRALALIEADGGPDASIVFLGDYADRGPDTRAVIDRLIAGRAAGRDWTCIGGNHDRMFHRFIRDGIEHDAHIKSGVGWLNARLGGPATLASYGVTGEFRLTRHRNGGLESLVCFDGAEGRTDRAGLQAIAATAVPEEHHAFLAMLPPWHQTDDLLFVHAGLRPRVALKDQDTDDLLWIRDPFLESDQDFGKLVVHGHTALDHPRHHGNRVNLDGGAGFGRPLVPAVFEGRTCWLLTGTGRVPLTP